LLFTGRCQEKGEEGEAEGNIEWEGEGDEEDTESRRGRLRKGSQGAETKINTDKGEEEGHITKISDSRKEERWLVPSKKHNDKEKGAEEVRKERGRKRERRRKERGRKWTRRKRATSPKLIIPGKRSDGSFPWLFALFWGPYIFFQLQLYIHIWFRRYLSTLAPLPLSSALAPPSSLLSPLSSLLSALSSLLSPLLLRSLSPPSYNQILGCGTLQPLSSLLSFPPLSSLLPPLIKF
jgi:hypothetical protein